MALNFFDVLGFFCAICTILALGIVLALTAISLFLLANDELPPPADKKTERAWGIGSPKIIFYPNGDVFTVTRPEETVIFPHGIRYYGTCEYNCKGSSGKKVFTGWWFHNPHDPDEGPICNAYGEPYYLDGNEWETSPRIIPPYRQNAGVA